MFYLAILAFFLCTCFLLPSDRKPYNFNYKDSGWGGTLCDILILKLTTSCIESLWFLAENLPEKVGWQPAKHQTIQLIGWSSIRFIPERTVMGGYECQWYKYGRLCKLLYPFLQTPVRSICLVTFLTFYVLFGLSSFSCSVCVWVQRLICAS